jgi:TetR/AcrR family tetracycline transcriptional repressor
VQRLRALLSEDRTDEEFEVSLEALLDRLDRELSQ